jgi:hypothetical protein
MLLTTGSVCSLILKMAVQCACYKSKQFHCLCFNL